MKSGVFLSFNYLVVVVFLLSLYPEKISTCDTKWIRFVYMMSCGKKKRESVSAHNETFYENLPGDFEGAVKYFQDRDPFNPMFSNEALLYKMLEEDEKSFRLPSHLPKFIGAEKSIRIPKTTPISTTEKSSILVNKLLVKLKTENHLTGIPGFPDQWDIEEILDEKINENHRREIDRLIEECCKIPPVTTCNGNTFLGACK